MNNDDEVSAHRTRSNRRPTPQLQPSQSLVAAVNAVYEPIEDKL